MSLTGAFPVGQTVRSSITAAYAQDGRRKSVKTLKIQKSSAEATALYSIEPDGTVRIDWNAVEAKGRQNDVCARGGDAGDPWPKWKPTR